MANKCASGGCSENELIALQNLQNMLQNNSNSITTGYNDWLNSTGAGGGSTILGALGDASGATQSASNVTNSMEGANSQGENTGNVFGSSELGDILRTTEAILTGAGSF